MTDGEKSNKWESSPTRRSTSEKIAAKRASERALQQLLRHAQSTFAQLNEQNQEVANENKHLHEKISKAETKHFETPGDCNITTDSINITQELSPRDLATEMSQSGATNRPEQGPVPQGEEEAVAQVQDELDRARVVFPRLFDDYKKMETDLELTWEQARRVQELEAELEKTKQSLKVRRESERVLQVSLKEALRLLKPLQGHLETAEREKKELAKQLRACRRRVTQLENEREKALEASPDTENNDSLEDENLRLVAALASLTMNGA